MQENALQLARHYLDIGNARRALEILDESVTFDPGDECQTILRCQALHDLERYRTAAEMARTGLSRAPESIGLFYLLSRSEMNLGNMAAAETAILSALRLDPLDPSLLCGYALLVAKAGQLDKADRLVAEAAAIEPGSEGVAQLRVIISHLRGDEAGMGDASRELLRINPEDTLARSALGSLSYEQGRVGKAAALYCDAARLDPSDSSIVATARELKVKTHWLLWPARLVHRFGPAGIYLGAVAGFAALYLVGLPRLAVIFMLVYMAFCLYTWVAPLLERAISGKRKGL